jgi:hypothetical protein
VDAGVAPWYAEIGGSSSSAQTVWMCAKVRSLSSSRSSRIWSYAVRRALLLEDLRLARMTDRNTWSMVIAPMRECVLFIGTQFSNLYTAVHSKALRISPTLPKWVLTVFLEAPSQAIRLQISLARRTVCMRLCLRGKAARRASHTFTETQD